MLELKGHCAYCELPMTFQGIKKGLSFHQPSCEMDITLSRFPFTIGLEELNPIDRLKEDLIEEDK